MKVETLNACPLCGMADIRMVDTPSNICQCHGCRYIFDNPRPTLEELVAFYSQPSKYDSWLSEEDARHQLWERRLSQLLKIKKSGSLLDVGSGIGQFLDLARPHFSSVCGTEVSNSGIEIAEKKYGLKLLRGEVDSIDFGAERFDNITVFHVLEHVPNPRLLIEKCARLLNVGGILVIAVPNDVKSLKARTKRFLRAIGVPRFRRKGRMGLPKLVLDGSISEIHLSHFTPSTLQTLVERSGFSVLSNTLDPYYVAHGANRWVQGGYYEFCRVVRLASGLNIYDTILMVARKDVE